MRNVSRCDHCGQSDDHPKVHVGFGGTFHHDCLDADLRAQLIVHPTAGPIILAAESGVRGDDLLATIAGLHDEEG